VDVYRKVSNAHVSKLRQMVFAPIVVIDCLLASASFKEQSLVS
jgi:hypothetical protein